MKLKKSRGICTADQLASKFPISHYYRILGVKADTKPEDIKKAYFDKSKRHHPDLYPDDKGKLLSEPNSKGPNENDLEMIFSWFSENPVKFPQFNLILFYFKNHKYLESKYIRSQQG